MMHTPSHPPLQPGDKIRFISPASSPDRQAVAEAAEVLAGWGFAVEFGRYAFEKLNYLAGIDQQRIDDLNDAIRDPSVRAVFATRGGKGSYRIADRIDFDAARRDPKFMVGFSDITAIHCACAKHGIGGGIHGALYIEDRTAPDAARGAMLRHLLTTDGDVTFDADETIGTSKLTGAGRVRGILVGGNLDMVATTAGWALPDLRGKILLLEAVDMYLGQIDRRLAMLTKAGHLDGVAGIALGQFKDIPDSGSLTVNDLLAEYLVPLEVPVLGGLPFGHDRGAQPVPLCLPTTLDCETGSLVVER